MKVKKVITLTITSIAALMIIMSGVMKLSQNEVVVSKMNAFGVGEHIILLGLMEIIFIILFLYPKTMKTGFLLLTCYFSGAIATDLSHASSIVNAALVLTLVWIAGYMRDRFIFLPRTSS